MQMHEKAIFNCHIKIFYIQRMSAHRRNILVNSYIGNLVKYCHIKEGFFYIISLANATFTNGADH